MFNTVELPVWFVVIVAILAVIAAVERVMFPSVRWYLRRRMQKVVNRVNRRLKRPIEPFKLARRHDMIQRLSYDPEVAVAIKEHAAAEAIPEEVAFEQAQRYAREIVPSFSASAYFGIATRASRFLSRALYRVRLGAYDTTLAQVPDDATVVFVMNHRSNMDYVLVTYLAAEQSALSYAVGEWARVWPLSRLIKAMGAFFIRRKSRGLLYRRVLARYVQMATEGGVTQAIFPEGGLSLDGHLAPPKMGLLNYVIQGWSEASTRDVVFVPVAINYDRVVEDRILLEAGRTGTRRFKARISVVAGFVLRQFWLRLTGGYYRMGYAAASFGEPLSLRDWPGNVPNNVEAIATELMDRIKTVMPVLPVPLVARVLVDRGALPETELRRIIRHIVQRLPTGHLHLPRENIDYAVDVGLRMLRLRHLIVEDDGIIAIKPDEEAILRYYAASIAPLDEIE